MRAYRDQPAFGLVSDFMSASPNRLPVQDPQHITCIENLEHVLLHMDNQHFDLLYDDWAWDNKKARSSESKEIVKVRAKRSISKIGDENLKSIEDSFEAFGKEEALAALKALDANIIKKG